ncbi:MAG: amylo-alpha-1,6-glucosidase [Pirellulaceae bacterium]
MSDLVRALSGHEGDVQSLLTREWLVTNGLGGYASGTISGAVTRRYHGWLISALSRGRTMMFNHLSERVRLPGGRVAWLGAEERADGSLALPGALFLREFRLEAGMPVWVFDVSGFVIEKRVLMPYRQNTVHILYRLVKGQGAVRLNLRPSVHFRPHDAPVSEQVLEAYTISATEERLELTTSRDFPPLRMLLYGRRVSFTLKGRKLQNIYYRIEAGRGYDSTGELWSPGYFSMVLTKGVDATLVASTEEWETTRVLEPHTALSTERERRDRLVAAAVPEARCGIPAELVLAADQFLILPCGRAEDAARARAAGEEVRTVIAGYHWFTDWGRDTMISLEGLALVTGRHTEAGWILRTFLHYMRDGLIPNMFPEGENTGLYHTADATLWLFHALDRYVTTTHDNPTLEVAIPKLLEIIEAHKRGTRFGISVDPEDGLLRQGEEDYALTWMDAKWNRWVVTPRRGKTVEINALWYNALRLTEAWVRNKHGDPAAAGLQEMADRVYQAFNRRYWYEEGGHLYDVVDGEQGDDASCRPNQLLAISLRHPVLRQEHWEPVVKTARERLWTPVGLRSLAPESPQYKPTYHGDLEVRDSAYHQGTVWAWLIGPFVDAWLKVYPDDKAAARELLEGFGPHLNEACVGSISEIFDAERPFTARGCIAQAWSVAEVLRALVKTQQ